MSQNIVSAFPKGFVLGPGAVPEGYTKSEVRADLAVHPELSVAGEISPSGAYVIALGQIASVLSSEPTNVLSALLERLIESRDSFYTYLDTIVGRYAIIFGRSESEVSVVSDATGMRAIYYDWSRRTVSSHAALVQSCESAGELQEYPFKFGFPGNKTPYYGVKLLSPNVALHLHTRNIERFYPRATPERLSVTEAAQTVVDLAVTSVQRVCKGRPVQLALTAGLDSRVLLAIMLKSGVPFETYTYGNDAATLIDRKVAADLSALLGINHATIDQRADAPDLKAQVNEAHYEYHHGPWVEALGNCFSWSQPMVLTSNLLEIGRDFFKIARAQGSGAPVTPERMAAVHYQWMGQGTRAKADAFGFERHRGESIDAFATFIADNHFLQGCEYIDSFDLFYWEHRMANWHGAVLVERDFYGEAFIPWNNRLTLATLLGVDLKSRTEGAVFFEILRHADERLMKIPINPKEYP